MIYTITKITIYTSWSNLQLQNRMMVYTHVLGIVHVLLQWGLYICAEKTSLFTRNLRPSQVILWLELDGKPKWLPLNFGYHDVMRKGPIGIAQPRPQPVHVICAYAAAEVHGVAFRTNCGGFKPTNGGSNITRRTIPSMEYMLNPI